MYSGTSVYFCFGISPNWYVPCLDIKKFCLVFDLCLEYSSCTYWKFSRSKLLIFPLFLMEQMCLVFVLYILEEIKDVCQGTTELMKNYKLTFFLGSKPCFIKIPIIYALKGLVASYYKATQDR